MNIHIFYNLTGNLCVQSNPRFYYQLDNDNFFFVWRKVYNNSDKPNILVGTPHHLPKKVRSALIQQGYIKKSELHLYA